MIARIGCRDNFKISSPSRIRVDDLPLALPSSMAEIQGLPEFKNDRSH
jgi:hypothetical protein